MSNQRKSPFAGLTTSCLKAPFMWSHKKKSIHTMNAWTSESPKSGTSEPCDASSRGEKNVNRIMKMIPGLSHLRKSPAEKIAEPVIDCLKTTVMTEASSEMGKLIEISPPSRTDRNEELETKIGGSSKKKRRSSDKPGSSKKPQEDSSNYRIHSRRPRKESKTNLKLLDKKKRVESQRLKINRLCLNVKVTGPLYTTLGKVINDEIKKVITISGAGISTAAGIPDFRSPDTGMYDKLKKYNLPYAQAVFERKYFDKNPKPLYALLKETLVTEYKPTIAHYFIKLLDEKGLLLRHFTQNVDGLERLAGISDDRIVEAHGTVYTSRCMKCKIEYDLQWLRDQLIYQGKAIPYCQQPNCRGVVKPNVVLFGETLDSQFTTCVSKDLPRCDLLIIMGTSLVVEPFASTVKKVSSSCPRIIINNIPVGEHLGIVYEGSKEFSRQKRKDTWRDTFIQGSCDDGVLHLAKLFKWERELEDLVKRCEPSHTSNASPSGSIERHFKSRARETDRHERTVKKDAQSNYLKGCTESNRKRSIENKTPSQSLLLTDRSPWNEGETSAPAQTSDKNWWRSLTSKVRNLTNNPRQ